jgi:hypothetical protein
MFYFFKFVTYCSLGSASTLKKQIIIFFQFFFKNYVFFHHLLKHCDMNSEIIKSVAYDNYDDFQHQLYIFTKFHFTVLRIIQCLN